MPNPTLDDPAYSAFAWRRFRRILKWMAVVSGASAAAAVLILWAWLGEFYLHASIATALGVFLTMMLGALLMGLAFLSSGTGHDEQVHDPLANPAERD